MNTLKELYNERRSVNFFDKNKKVDDKVLQDIVNLAVLAPSAFNLQPWEIIAVKSDEAKQRLLPLAMNQPKVVEAPVTLIVLGDRNGYSKENVMWDEIASMMKDDKKLEATQGFAAMLYGTSEERKIKFAESNAGLLAMSLMYAAKYYGVESHAMSGIDFEGIKKEFNIDGEKEVVMLITLGYFDEVQSLYPRSKRKLYDEIVKEV